MIIVPAALKGGHDAPGSYAAGPLTVEDGFIEIQGVRPSLHGSAPIFCAPTLYRCSSESYFHHR
jgi:hypothetical protein